MLGGFGGFGEFVYLIVRAGPDPFSLRLDLPEPIRFLDVQVGFGRLRYQARPLPHETA